MTHPWLPTAAAAALISSLGVAAMAQSAAEPPLASPLTFDAAIAIASKETVADDKLIIFMEKYPPILWKDRQGSAVLLKQCEAAAKRWKKKAEDAGTFSGEVKKRYEKFSLGLGGGGN